MSAPAWDSERAFERARVAYRYVAADFPDSADLEILAPYTAAAHEAERRGDREGFEAALRELMRAARRDAREGGRGVRFSGRPDGLIPRSSRLGSGHAKLDPNKSLV